MVHSPTYTVFLHHWSPISRTKAEYLTSVYKDLPSSEKTSLLCVPSVFQLISFPFCPSRPNLWHRIRLPRFFVSFHRSGTTGSKKRQCMKRQKIGDSEIAVDTRMIANGLQQEMRDGQGKQLVSPKRQECSE